ncbi:MAG TPA: ABC transporter permease [Chitinophagaceae bacterium]|nr:ABC transporter permease [Chitinophagaceae bacterium]
MIKNYFLVFFRNIRRNKTFTILNAGGFALGMAACILIVLFISHEKSFDRFHEKGNRLYRLNEWQRFDGMQEQQVALSMYPMGPALLKDYPEIESFVRIQHRETSVTRNSRQEIMEYNQLVVDSNFFDLFSFTLLSGNKKEALSSPTSVVVTASVAQSLFNTTNAIGQTLEIKRGNEFTPHTVSAVVKDIPANSHIRFDMLTPMSGLKKQPWMDTWETNWLNTYLLLKENARVEKLAAALPGFEKKYLAKEDRFYDLLLQPFFSIHLYSTNITHDSLNYGKFSAAHINTFMALAIAVLVIAVFNFINLSTAIAIKRAREAGIRKTIGAGKGQLIRQFTGEAILLSFISFILAILVTALILPLINTVFDRDISLGFVSRRFIWLILLFAVVIVGVLSGIYPAWIISKYKPVSMVKGAAGLQSRKGLSLRPVLVVMQFTVAVGLIISTILISRQLRYLQKKDIGFDKEQVVLLRMNSTANKKYEALKHQLIGNKGVEDITAYNERLGKNINQWGADYIAESGETKHVSVSHVIVDYNYIPFFKIKLAEGRNFSPAFADSAGRSYLINEALAKQLDISKPVGGRYKGSFIKEMGTIIGVVKDFNFNSLHHQVAPLYISMQNWDFNEMAIRLKPGTVASSLGYIEKVWKTEVPDMPFSYAFLDEHIQSLYRADQQSGIIVNIATLLAIFIACLGLFGMALYTIESRVKEIGIRKVLGATVQGITMHLSRNFLKLVLISAVISFPLAWMVMQKWLGDFAYRINMPWWVFALAGLMALTVAMITVVFQAVKAAVANPVKSLRTE